MAARAAILDKKILKWHPLEVTWRLKTNFLFYSNMFGIREQELIFSIQAFAQVSNPDPYDSLVSFFMSIKVLSLWHFACSIGSLNNYVPLWDHFSGLQQEGQWE